MAVRKVMARMQAVRNSRGQLIAQPNRDVRTLGGDLSQVRSLKGDQRKSDSGLRAAASMADRKGQYRAIRVALGLNGG